MKTIIHTQRVEVIESYNERRDCADQRIGEFIHSCGFLPMAVPNNPTIVKDILKFAKPRGIVLVGGNSLVKYGGNAPERDSTDEFLIDFAIKSKIPLYGFCRGMQSILDYFGNVLVKVSGHAGIRHEVKGDEGCFEVNSYHNEACLELVNDELVSVMRTEDGVIEKVKHRTLPIVGTMWHPERENPFRDIDVAMVQELMSER